MNTQNTPVQPHPKPEPEPPRVDVSKSDHAGIALPATAEQLQKVERRMTGYEKATLRWARSAVVISTLAVFFACAQWYEMHTGATDTHALADAAGKQATDTHTLAGQAATQATQTTNLAAAATNQAAATNILAEQARISAQVAKESVADSRNTAYRELRPYITVKDMLLVGDIDDGKPFKGVATITNSGRTPAIEMQVCADVTISASSLKDDYSCPSPVSPKQRIGETEPSIVALGSGSDGQVASPGTTMNIQPAGLLPLLTDHRFTLYFYGYISYRDTIRPNIVHQTLFCGAYGVQSKGWNACEHHNRIN